MKRFLLPAGLLLGFGSALHAQETQSVAVQRHALLVGIGDYPVAEWQRLEGPAGDVAAMRSILIERGGFQADHVTTLLEEQATRSNILAALQRLREDAAPGDLLLFYFAGHGSWLADDNGDELHDGLDETLVPWDALAADGTRQDLRDDLLRDFVRAANVKTERVVLVFDCCHSGTAVRGGGVALRQVPGPAGVAVRGLGDKRESLVAQRSDATGVAAADLDYVALSACRADQAAAELHADPNSSKRQGLFSWALVQSLAQAGPNATYVELMDNTRWRVHQMHPRQTPVLEGRGKQQPVLAGGVAAARPFFSLTAGSSRGQAQDASLKPGVELAAGTIHGLSAGAELVVCPAGTLDPETGEVLGVLRVRGAETVRARAVWLTQTPPPERLESARAFLLRLAPSAFRLQLDLDDTAPAPPAGPLLACRDLVGHFPLIAFGETGSARFHLAWKSGSWQLNGSLGRALPLSARAGNPREMSLLIGRLNHLARAARLRSVANETPSGLRFEVEYERLKETSGRWQAGGPMQRGPSGEVEVRHLDSYRTSLVNHNAFPVYASYLLFSPDGEINVLWTTESQDDAIAPGTRRWSNRIELFIPSENEEFYRQGSCMGRWVVTRDWHDLRDLEQKPAPDVAPTRSNGGVPGGIAGGQVGAPVDDWATRSLEFRLLPAQD